MRRRGFTRSDTDSMPLFRQTREPGLGTRDASCAWTPDSGKIEGRCEFPLATGGHPEHEPDALGFVSKRRHGVIVPEPWGIEMSQRTMLKRNRRADPDDVEVEGAETMHVTPY